MFFSYAGRSRLLQVGALAIVGAMLLTIARPAAAQGYRPIPADAKGYQVVMITQQNLARQAAQRPLERSRSAVPATYEVVYEERPALPRVVTFEGPDGTVRTFVLEGSIRTVQPRQVLVRLTSK